MRVFIRQFLDLKFQRVPHWAVALVSATLATAGVRISADQLAYQQQQEYALELATQVAHSAEGLILTATQLGVSDPIAWVIFHLSQGIEPRHIHITRESQPLVDGVSIQTPERLEFEKSLNIPGSSEFEGVRITVTLPNKGPLAAKYRLGRDLLSAISAALLSVFLLLALKARVTKKTQKRIAQIAPQLSRTVTENKHQIRTIFQHFEKLGRASEIAHHNVVHARAEFHHSIQQSRRVLQHSDGVMGCTLQAEATLLNLLLQSSRKSEKTANFQYPTHLLYQQISAIKNRSAQLQVEIRDLERRLEPLATDLDLGFHALSDANDSLLAVPEEIQETTQRVTRQSGLLDQLRQEIAS